MREIEDALLPLLLKLDERAFFSLAKNYLGPISSPFDKRKLAHSIAVFLRKPATQTAIAERLEAKDCAALSALLYLGPATLAEAGSFLAPMAQEEIEALFLNMRERLLIFYDADSGRYMANPALDDLFKQLNLGEGFLFYSEESQSETEEFWLTDTLLAALLSVCFNKPEKKSAQEAVQAALPQLTSIQAQGALQACSALGFFTDSFAPNAQALFNFSRLNAKERRAYLAAAYAGLGQNLEPLAAAVLDLFANFQHRTAPENLVYRLYAAKRLEPLTRDQFNRLAAFGLWKQGAFGISFVSFSEQESGKLLSFEADFSCLLFPLAQFCPALVCSCRLERFDTASRFILERESFFNAMRAGYSPQSLIEELERCNEQPLPENVKANIVHWAGFFSSASLYQGYVLALNEEKSRLAKATGALDPFVIKEIAGGVYWLKEASSPLFYAALEKLGLPPIAMEQQENGASFDFLPLQTPKPVAASVNDVPFRRQAIDDLLIQTENHELKRRIERKVILFPSQLDGEEPRVEEAGALDFQGKTRIIEMALAHNDLVEAAVARGRDILHLRLKPLSMEKLEKGLALCARDEKSGKVITFSITKIVSIKLISSSLI